MLALCRHAWFQGRVFGPSLVRSRTLSWTAQTQRYRYAHDGSLMLVRPS